MEMIRPRWLRDAEDAEGLLTTEKTARHSILNASRSLFNFEYSNIKSPFAQPASLHETSYLDGLRGVACLFVVFHHVTTGFYPWLEMGYGAPDGSLNPGGEPLPNHAFLSLPFLRITHAGGAMVGIFFTISGYVLSIKSVKLARADNITSLYESLSGSTFRRGPRLYFPMITASLIAMIAAQLGLCRPYFYLWHYSVADGIFSQLQTWFLINLRSISYYSGGNGWEPVLWTIPVDRPVSKAAVGFPRGMMIFWMWYQNVAEWLFTAGMLCAEVHFWHTSNSIKLAADSPRRHVVREVGLSAIFVVNLYLLGTPDPGHGQTESYGYQSLTTTFTLPQYRGWAPMSSDSFWPCMSAISMVLLLDFAGPASYLQRLFCTGISQWLGKVSFSMYLWHHFVMQVVYSPVLKAVTDVYGISDPWLPSYQSGAAVIGVGLLWLPVLACVSEASTRTLDVWGIKLAKLIMRW
ncbi:uncharacterized protein AB675_1717 [Cyphellophora attinorum]|uniref:Acyltransferase 3 domain-containing protein n=1 Tax=Cyphellophora attinorum TaxID=1664694 RepID=A0A0N1H7W3_9EURO|nr:uncharacterized protein AB675_1717 [Phialophora attinorum]KPI42742.1 hypothetical protein AB675_1717 [Phialophora attinorum]